MTTQGMRFFTLQVFDGKKRNPLTYWQDPLPDPVDLLSHGFEGISSKLLPVKGLLTVEPDQDPEPGDPMIRIEKVRTMGSNVVGVKVAYGRLDAFPAAYSPTGDAPTDLRGKVPAQQFLFVVLLPRSGDTAVVASHTRGRSHIEGSAFQVLRRIFFRERGNCSDPSSPRPLDYRWVLHKAVDEARLDEVLKDAQATELSLISSHRTRGGRETERKLVVTQKTVINQGKVKDIIRRWLHRDPGQDDDPARALVEAFDDDLDLSLLHFDDGSIRLSYDGTKETVKPDSLDKFLTYPLDTVPVTLDSLREEAETRLRNIQGCFGADLDI